MERRELLYESKNTQVHPTADGEFLSRQFKDEATAVNDPQCGKSGSPGIDYRVAA